MNGGIDNAGYHASFEALIEGRLKLDQWEDKQGGGKRSKVTVVIESFQFVGGKSDGGGERQPQRQQQPAAQAEAPAVEFSEDEIPF